MRTEVRAPVMPWRPRRSLHGMGVAATPFVGREADLRRFERCVKDRARLVVVRGEAGIGKTRLLDEGVARLPVDLAVFRGASDRDGARPLGAIIDALRDQVASWPALPDALRRHREVVGSLFGHAPGAPPMGRDLDPAEVADGILATLDQVAGRRHGLLVLDDLHWGDGDIAGVIDRITRSDVRCTVVASMRDEVNIDDALVEMLHDASRHCSNERISLKPLTVAEVEQLLRASIGLVAAAMAEDVHERTGGHPLLLTQLLDMGELSSSTSLAELPASVDESVRHRMLGLDRTTRLALNATAVLGRSASFAALSSFTGLDEDDLLEALHELCARRLLVEAGHDQFAFVHALARETVESSLLTRERRRLHTRALDVLGPDAQPLEVLRHALEAGDTVRQCEAARRGAAPALAGGHPSVALRMARAGLDVRPDDLQLTIVKANSAWRLRHREEAAGAARRAIALAGNGEPLVVARLHRLLARLAWETADREAHRASTDAMVELVDRVGAQHRAEVLASIAEATMLVDHDDAVAWAERAMDAAASHPELQTAGLINLGSALTSVRDRRHEGREMLRRAVELTADGPDAFSEARALNNLLCEIVYVDASADVQTVLERFEHRTMSAGLAPQFGENVALWRAVHAERVGDQRAALDAVEWFGPVEPDGTGCLALLAVSIDLDRSRPAEALARLARIGATLTGERANSHSAWTRAIETELAVRYQNADPVAQLVRLFDPDEWPRWYMLDLLDRVGRAAVIIARHAPDLAARAAECWQAWTAGDVDAGSIHAHLLAIADEHNNAAAAAKEHYEQSLLGHPRRAATIVADAELGIARCCDCLGDRAAARQWASSAQTRLADWPGPDSDQAIRLLRTFGGRPPRQIGTSVLSDREREVAALVSQGCTNAEIGRRLYISTRTVGVHVTHILGKLNAAKRSEIAAHAVRQGWAG
jgi:DNA-binding CsgD family transcriptional regulator